MYLGLAATAPTVASVPRPFDGSCSLGGGLPAKLSWATVTPLKNPDISKPITVLLDGRRYGGRLVLRAPLFARKVRLLCYRKDMIAWYPTLASLSLVVS
jgi:hypothetical protein